MSAPFTFAHLSDPHLSTLAAIKPRDLASKRILGYLNWRRRRSREHKREILDALVRDLHQRGPDHTVVTGDLTNLGLPEECREVAAWLAAVGEPAMVTVVPGNHDCYVHAPWEQTLGLWESYLRGDDCRQQEQALFPSLRIRDQIAFIGVSTAVPSRPFLAVGTVGAQQLDRLEAVLAATAEQGLYRVVLIHHPPMSDLVGNRKGLTDGVAFRALLARHGADLVLHGHAHVVAVGELPVPGGRVPVIGVPSASMHHQRSHRRAQYNLYRVYREDGRWRLEIEVRGLNEDGHGFHTMTRLER